MTEVKEALTPEQAVKQLRLFGAWYFVSRPLGWSFLGALTAFGSFFVCSALGMFQRLESSQVQWLFAQFMLLGMLLFFLLGLMRAYLGSLLFIAVHEPLREQFLQVIAERMGSEPSPESLKSAIQFFKSGGPWQQESQPGERFGGFSEFVLSVLKGAFCSVAWKVLSGQPELLAKLVDSSETVGEQLSRRLRRQRKLATALTTVVAILTFVSMASGQSL